MTIQGSRTSDLIFSVPRLIADLSALLLLLPGRRDLHLHPGRTGAVRQPPVFLAPGQTLESWIEGIGAIRNRCV